MSNEVQESHTRSRQAREDAVLLTRIADHGRKSRQALAELYRRYVAAVHTMLRRLDSSLSGQDCEDLTQQVFLEVWQNPGRFRGDCGVLHYLVRIAANLLSKHRRGTSRRTRREADTSGAGQDDGQESLRYLETADLVRSAMANLPADQRQAVDLVYVHGHTVSEAAAIVGCSPAALRKRLHRGKMFLLKRLEQIP